MHIVRGVTRHCDAAFLGRVLILAMTATRANVPPPVILDQIYQIADFHVVPCLILSLRHWLGHRRKTI